MEINNQTPPNSSGNIVPNEPQSSSFPPAPNTASQEIPPTSQAPVNPPILETPVRSGRSPYKIFIIFAVLLIIVIYSVVAYIYFQNKNLSENSSEETTTGENGNQTTETGVKSFQVKIVNGSITKEVSGEEVQVLVNKENYPSTGITGFARVLASPDKSKICFESLPPAPEPALYIANIDGGSISEVNPNRQNCIWSSDSRQIYYISLASANKTSDIFQYDIESKVENNLTRASVPAGVIRRYEIVGFNADNTKIICKYENIVSTTQESSAASGNCEVELATGAVTLL